MRAAASGPLVMRAAASGPLVMRAAASRPLAMRGALRTEARKRRPHVLIACVAFALALSPAGPAAVGACALAAAIGCGWAFGSRSSHSGLADLYAPQGGMRAAGVAALLVVAAGAVGAARIAAIDRPASAAPSGTRLVATATLLEHPRPGAFGSTAVMRIEDGPARGLRILARRDARSWPVADARPPADPGGPAPDAGGPPADPGGPAADAGGRAVDPGTRFRIEGFVRRDEDAASGREPYPASEANAGKTGTPGFGPLPAAPRDGEFDYPAFLRSRGVGRQVDVDSLRQVGRRGGIQGAVDAIRARAERGISAGLKPNEAALARGMVLGDDSGIGAETREDFQRSGLAHLLAASGQNVALLCALVLPLLMVAGTAMRTRVVLLIPLIALYGALAGSGASIMRAGVMAAALLVAVAASRRGSAVYVLLLAAVVTLGLNPRATGDPGWQLSFAAVTGMLAFGPLVRPRLKRLPRPLADALGATVAATLATAPLMAHQFGAVSLAALPANVLAVPAVAPATWIGMAAGAAEQLATLGWPFGPVVHELQRTAAPIAELALRWLAWLASHFADRGWAQADVRIGWSAVAATYAATGALIGLRHAMRSPWPRGRPGGGRAGRIGELADWLRALTPASRRAFAAPLAALAIGGTVYASAPPRPPDRLTVDFIDVGQGDATLVRDPTGAAVLFDGGVPEARVDRTLRRLGVRRLTAVVATHQSRDHHGGLRQVIRRFPTGLFLDGGDGTTDPTFEALVDEVDHRGIPRRPARQGETLRAGAMRVRILWPPPSRPGQTPADPNPRATVAVVSYGSFDLLLTADAESETLLPLAIPRVDAMKVPHHGSADPGLPMVLDRVRPSVAVIETGRGNRYGHPRRPTLDALRARVPRVYRTDRDGTVELTLRGNRLAIRTHR